MTKFWLTLLAAATLHAALIHGLVVENQTGRPLARAVVTVEPVAGTPGTTQSVRTDGLGAFEFPPLPGGAYLVTASRRAFGTVQYGQKRWQSAGVPVTVEQAGAAALRIRLPRLGAVTGALLDENDVGLPDHDVAAYRVARPPQLITRVKTDDRGIYRIGGLEPGKYLIRTLAKQYEEGGYVPTFFRETTTVDQAFPVEADLDRETAEVNLHPAPGKLFAVSGRAVTFPPITVNMSLVSDMGTETTVTDTQGNFQFNPQPPGQYELFALVAGARSTAAYQPLTLDRDQTNLRMSLTAPPLVTVSLEDDKGVAIDPRPFRVLVRHKDLSGAGRSEAMRLTNGRGELLPGRWDVALAPTPAGYASGFWGPPPDRRERADGWNEIVAVPGPVIPLRFVISTKPAALHGTVSGPGRDAAAGAPVFLEPYDVPGRRPLGEVRFSRTDMRGQYYFYGLAPGDYRVVSTFEFRQLDSATLDLMAPKTVRLTEAKDDSMDLDLYVIP